MDYQQALIDLIAYCQREGVLSSGIDVCEEIASITGYDENTVCNELF